MPKRKYVHKRKVDSEEVQGKDSWVILMTPTFGDYKSIETGVPQEEGDSSAMMQFGISLLKTLIVDWNWVDDDDKPLPKPAENPDIVDDLPFQELIFLIQELNLEGVLDSTDLKKE